MFFRHCIAWVSVMVLVGCPGPAKVGDDAGMLVVDAGPIDDGQLVKGDLVNRFILPDGGVELAPIDLSASTVFAYFEADGGALTVQTAMGSAGGTFAIAVPKQRYILELGNIYISSELRTLHLGENLLGRNGVFVVNPGEGLSVTATNVAPWTSSDELQAVSWGAGLDYFSSAQSNKILKDTLPDAGDTSFAGLTINMDGSRVVEASKGDDFYLTQLSSQPLDGGTWKTVTRAASPKFDLALSTLTSVNFAFDTVPQQPLRLRIDTQSFELRAHEVNPTGVAFETRYLLDAHIGHFGPNTITSGAPDLGIFSVTADAGTIDFELSYGNPYPASYTPFVSVGTAFEALYRAPFADGGISQPRSEVSTISRVVTLSEAQSGPLAMTMSPVRDVRIDGQPIGSNFQTVARAPVISWSAPEVGTVSRVDIQAVQLVPATPTTRRLSGPTMRVIGNVNQVRLPENFLIPGATHYLRITSITQPPEWDQTAPLRDVGPPASTATLMTPAFQVAPLP